MTMSVSKIINNQNGSLMVIALLIMATLAVAGLMVTNDAIIESRVARNYAMQKQMVNAAEAAGKQFVQAIENAFSGVTSAVGVGNLDAVCRPYDDYNTTFDFDPDSFRNGTYTARSLTSNLEANIPYLTSAEAIAVLVDQTSSTPVYGLGASAVPEFYTYVIYCRAVHAGSANSEVLLMLGYRQPVGT